MNRSPLMTAAGTLGPTTSTATVGALLEQPFLVIVAGTLAIAFGALRIAEFVTFLPISAEKARIENEIRREDLRRPPDEPSATARSAD